MTSILTNNGAMVALQTLQSVNNDLDDTQKQISTGNEVGTASDNAAVVRVHAMRALTCKESAPRALGGWTASR